RSRLRLESLEDRVVPATSANTAFLQGLYVDLLHRSPQPAEIAAWTKALDQGVSHQQVALGFTSSPEFQGNIIEGLYQQILNRPSDTAGKAGRLQALQQGL